MQNVGSSLPHPEECSEATINISLEITVLVLDGIHRTEERIRRVPIFEHDNQLLSQLWRRELASLVTYI
jgi:hypothetical protein